MLFEVQEYSDITYRMYDYGRLTTAGTPRELHVERALDVSHFDVSPQVKVKPISLANAQGHEDRCLVACQYFVAREVVLRPHGNSSGYMKGKTEGSCIILSSLGAEVQVRYGTSLAFAEKLARGQTMVLPAALGNYRIEGTGRLVCSYVPAPGDEAWRSWEEQNRREVC